MGNMIFEFKEFKNFENDILQIEDDLKLAFIISTQFNDWPYRDKAFFTWKRTLLRIQKTLENVIEIYYREGFQYKAINMRDKIIVIAFLRFLQRILFFLKDESEIEFIDSILYLALSFDSDVSIQAFKALMLLSSVENISGKCVLHVNILKTLSEIDGIRLKKSFYLKNIRGEFASLGDLSEDIYEGFNELRTKCDIVDLYVKIIHRISKPMVKDIIKIYATILLSHQSINKDFYDKMKLSKKAIKLEKVLEMVKEFDFVSDARDKTGVKILNLNDIFNFKDLNEDCMDINALDVNLVSMLKENMGISSNMFEEAQFAIDNFILFHFEYDYNFSQIFLIMEMDSLDGYFYSHFKETLEKPCFENLLWFSLFEIFLHESRTDSLNINFIIDKYRRAIYSPPSDMVYKLLNVCYNYLKSCNTFFDEFVGCKVQLSLIDQIRSFHNVYNHEIIKLYIKNLFEIYKKENSGLEPFEDSSFFKALCEIVSQENSKHTSQAIGVVNYFLNSEPSSITKVTNTIFGNINLLYRRSDVKIGVVVSVLHLFDALSLNLEYGLKLRREKSFTLFLEDTFKLKNVKGIFKNYLINDAIQELLRHHPEYIQECYGFIESSFIKFQSKDFLKKIEEDNSEILKVFIIFILIIRPFMMDHVDKFNEEISTKLFELYSNNECNYGVIFNLNDSFCNFFKDPSIVDEQIIYNLNRLLLKEIDSVSLVLNTINDENIRKEKEFSIENKIIRHWGSTNHFLASFTRLERTLYLHSFLIEEQNNSRIILDSSKEKIMRGIILVIRYLNSFPREFNRAERKGSRTFSLRYKEVRKIILNKQNKDSIDDFCLNIIKSVYYGSLDIISYLFVDFSLIDVYFSNLGDVLKTLENLRESDQIYYKRRKISLVRTIEKLNDIYIGVFSDEEDILNEEFTYSSYKVNKYEEDPYCYVMYWNLKTFLNIISNSSNKLSYISVEYIFNWLHAHKVLRVSPIIPLEEQVRLIHNMTTKSDVSFDLSIKEKILSFLSDIKTKYVSIQLKIIDAVNHLFKCDGDISKESRKALFSVYKNNFNETESLNCDCIKGNEKVLMVLYKRKMFNNVSFHILEKYLDLPFILINYNFKLEKYSLTLLSKLIFILTYKSKKVDFPLMKRLLKKLNNSSTKAKVKMKYDIKNIKEFVDKLTHDCGSFKLNYELIYKIIDEIEESNIDRKDILTFLCNVLRYAQTCNHLLDDHVQIKILNYILKEEYSKTNMIYVHYLYEGLFDVFNNCSSFLTKKDGTFTVTYSNLSLLLRSPNLLLDVGAEAMSPMYNLNRSSFFCMERHMEMFRSQERLFKYMLSLESSRLFVLQIIIEIVYNNKRYVSFLDENFLINVINRSISENEAKNTKEENELIEMYYLLIVMLLQYCDIKVFNILSKEFLRIIEGDDLHALYKLFFVLHKSMTPLVLKTSILEKNSNKENIIILSERFLDSGIINKILDKIPNMNADEFRGISHDLKNCNSAYKNVNTVDNQIYMRNGIRINDRFNLSNSNINEDISNVLSNDKNGLSNIFMFIKYVLKFSYEDKMDQEYNFESENSYDQDSDDLNSNDQMDDGTFYVEESYNSNRLSSSVTSDYSEEEIVEDKDIEEDNQGFDINNESTNFEIHSTFRRIEQDYLDYNYDIKKWIEVKFIKNIEESEQFKENCSRTTAHGEGLPDTENSNSSGDFFHMDNENTNENNEESISIEEEDEDERSIGIEGGEIPDISIEFLNTMGEEEINCFVQLTNEERRSRSLYYVPLDKSFLDSLDERVRRIFVREELILEESYFEREDSDTLSESSLEEDIQGIDIKVDHTSVVNLVESFLKNNLIGKHQIKGVIEILYYDKKLRGKILECSRTQLFESYYRIFYCDENHEEHIETIKRVLNNFHMNCTKFKRSQVEIKLPLHTRNILMYFLRFEEIWEVCLWIILKLYQGNLYRLLNFELGTKDSDGIKYLDSNELNLFFTREVIGRHCLADKKVVSIESFLRISHHKLTKRIYNLISNSIEKIFLSHFDDFFFYTFDKINDVLSEIYSLQREAFLSLEFLEKQEILKNLVFFLKTSLDSWIDYILTVPYYKNLLEVFFYKLKLENRGFKYIDYKFLKELYKNFDYRFEEKNYLDDDRERFLSRKVVEMLYNSLSNRVFNVNEVDFSVDITLNGVLLNSYFTLFNIAEIVSNIIIIFKPDGNIATKFDLLKLYEDRRKEFVKFSEAKVIEVNEILKNENEIFRDNIFFLSRFNVINYNNKQEFIRNKIKEMKIYKDGSYTVVVRRKSVLDDSFFQIMNKTPKEFRSKKMQIKFSGEEGLDFGGLTKEWLDLILKEILNPNYGLFVHSSEKKTIVQPFKRSNVNSEHLLFYRFIGRIIAKVILDGYNIDLHLDRSVYKYFLGKRYDISDLEINDPQFYNSLIWIRDNPIKDVLNLTFSTDYTEFGESIVVDLKPNGRNLSVTDENKREYLDLIVEHRLFKGIESQINAIKTGLFEILSEDLLSIFNEKELELLISGIPDINVDDWMNNTNYYGYTKSSQNILWFWKAIKSFSSEEKAKLLQFSTGSSRLPYEGFSHLQGNNGLQKFSIHKTSSDNKRLPSAHTCFNQLDLPEYTNYNDLRKSILYAINECTEGFGLI